MLKLQNSQVFLTFLLYDETLQGALDKAGFTNLLGLLITEQFLRRCSSITKSLGTIDFDA